jgi:hypothetical protein
MCAKASNPRRGTADPRPMISSRLSAVLALLDTLPSSPAVRRLETALIHARVLAVRLELEDPEAAVLMWRHERAIAEERATTN